MTQGINFLKPKQATDLLFSYQAARLKVGSIILLIVYCLVTAATTAFSINLGQNQKRIASEIQVKKSRVEEMKKIESLQTILKQRLTSLVEFKKTDTLSYSKIIKAILEMTLSGVMINSATISEEGLVVLEGNAFSSSILKNFLDRLIAEDSMFSTVTLSSLVRQESGNYIFTVDLKKARDD